MKIDWAYLRNGWVSCKKALKFFEQNNIDLVERSDARKEKINEEQAWQAISEFSKVYIGKGKKVLEFEPTPDNREEILKAAMGRSGNLRAPALKTKDAVFIGFNEEIYSQL